MTAPKYRIVHIGDIGGDSKIAQYSDRNNLYGNHTGAWKIRNFDLLDEETQLRRDYQTERRRAEERNRRLTAARQKVKREAPHLLSTFDLIVKNGNNREESILALMREFQKGDK